MKKSFCVAFSLGLGLVAVLLIMGRPVTVRAAEDFNMNFIISDAEFTDGASMSKGMIQQFLEGQSGILDTFTMTTADGKKKSAAEIIAEMAETYDISPRVILTNIQKESSMLTRNSFPYKPAKYYLDRIVFYSWCDSCSDVRPEFLGFENQIRYSTAAFRRYLNQIELQGYTISGWGPGRTKNLTCISSDAARGLCTSGKTIRVQPVNSATSALYTYTPHPGGNYSFWSIWNRYNFGYQRTYPDGSLLRAKGSGTIFLLQAGRKRPFVSQAAFYSRYSPGSVITVPSDQLFFYENGAPIRFANYSVLRAPNGRIYLLVDDTLRNFVSWAAFKSAGFQRSEIVKVKTSDLADYQIGQKITTENIYPSGRLMQGSESGVIWYVKDGQRHLILSKQIYRSQFGKRRPSGVREKTLEKYPIAEPVGFKDGELVRTKKDARVYFISNGQRRPIMSWEAAKLYRFDKIWKNVIVTNDISLNLHPLGDPITVPVPEVQVASN